MSQHYAVDWEVRYYMPPPRQVRLRGSAFLAIAAPPPNRGDSDVSWKEPPHVALANMQDDPDAALRFTRMYGALAPNYAGEQDIELPVSSVFAFRDSLRRAWNGDYESLSLILDVVKAEVRLSPTGMEIVPMNLWTLIRVTFARDFWGKRAKKCENPDCPAPYYLAVRKGQKFCGQKCAVLINVRRFREREARLTAKKRKHQLKGSK